MDRDAVADFCEVPHRLPRFHHMKEDRRSAGQGADAGGFAREIGNARHQTQGGIRQRLGVGDHACQRQPARRGVVAAAYPRLIEPAFVSHRPHQVEGARSWPSQVVGNLRQRRALIDRLNKSCSCFDVF
jgi:hypothetical protein